MRLILTAAGLAGATLLAGCDAYDPLLRAGVYRPQHVNRADLTMMAANPADLVRGTGDATSDGVMAEGAIDRMHNNKLKKLPDTSVGPIAEGTSTD